MKTLIYQYYSHPPKNDNHYISTDFPYWELSKKSIEAYAHMFNSDYKFLSDPHPIAPFYGIFFPFTEGWCDEYDAICFIDSDMLATVNAESIWNHTSKDCVSAYFMSTQSIVKNYAALPYLHTRGHINSGTVVFPRAVYADMKQELKGLQDYHKLVIAEDKMIGALGKFDQAFINIFVNKQQKSKDLPEKFNYHLGRLNKVQKWGASLIHYHRKHKTMMQIDISDNRILK